MSKPTTLLRLWLLEKWIKIGRRLFDWNYVNIYAPRKSNVEGVTFSKNEKYIERVGKIELKKKKKK